MSDDGDYIRIPRLRTMLALAGTWVRARFDRVMARDRGRTIETVTGVFTSSGRCGRISNTDSSGQWTITLTGESPTAARPPEDIKTAESETTKTIGTGGARHPESRG